MTLLSQCYCAQASWLAGLIFRVIKSSGHTGVKHHGKGKNKVKRSPGNQVDGGGPPCIARSVTPGASKWAGHCLEFECNIPAAKLSGPNECPSVPQTAMQSFATTLKG